METTKKQYGIIGRFDYNSIKGDLFTIEEFIAYVEEGCFVPFDGHIGRVIIDGYHVNITIPKWSPEEWSLTQSGKNAIYTLQELESEFKGKKVEVVWYNK